MKRLLLHLESHNVVIVDITKVETSNTDLRQGNRQTVPAFRFTRKDAKEYLRAVGANDETLEEAYSQLGKTGVAVLTIV